MCILVRFASLIMHMRILFRDYKQKFHRPIKGISISNDCTLELKKCYRLCRSHIKINFSLSVHHFILPMISICARRGGLCIKTNSTTVSIPRNMHCIIFYVYTRALIMHMRNLFRKLSKRRTIFERLSTIPSLVKHDYSLRRNSTAWPISNSSV
jgi:hypothetical protein